MSAGDKTCPCPARARVGAHTSGQVSVPVCCRVQFGSFSLPPAPPGGRDGLTGGCPDRVLCPGHAPSSGPAPPVPPARSDSRSRARRGLRGSTPRVGRRRHRQDPTAAPGAGGRRRHNSPQPSLVSASAVFVFVIPLFFNCDFSGGERCWIDKPWRRKGLWAPLKFTFTKDTENK